MSVISAMSDCSSGDPPSIHRSIRGPCDRSCGGGQSMRGRHITETPKNGGEARVRDDVKPWLGLSLGERTSDPGCEDI